MSNSITELGILKAFSVNIHARKAPSIKQVDWQPPNCGWIKCNSDGAARGNPSYAACGGLFRGSKGEILGCFAENLGISSSLFAEISAAMNAIEIAFEKG